MPFDLKGYKIFIASPGGLNDERDNFRKTIDEYNITDAIPKGIIFKAEGWEFTNGGMGRPQSLINEKLRECDYFIMILHNRWGTNPGQNEHNATSGTHEEFKVAIDCYHDEAYPMRDVKVLFKAVSPVQMSDPGNELKKVLEFKEQLESEKPLLYDSFSSIEEFNFQLRKYLASWLRDTGPTTNFKDFSPPRSPLDQDYNLGLKYDSLEDRIIQNDTEVDPKDKEIIDKAWQLMGEGHFVQAEVELSKAMVNKPGIFQLSNYANFLGKMGRIDQAIPMVDRALEISIKNKDLKSKSSLFDQKGNLLLNRRELDSAEEMFQESLKINVELDNREGMALNYKNIGEVSRIRANMHKARESFNKSLEIYSELDNREGMATNYVKLGNVYMSMRNLPKAEELYRKALEINQELNRRRGLASNYGNIGMVLLFRGDENGADEMIKKSLEINKELGNLEGLISNYGCLGTLHEKQRDMPEAEEMYKKALYFSHMLGNIESVADAYSNIGFISQNQGNLPKAEEMLKNAIEINEKLNRTEHLGNLYLKLGVVLHSQGKLHEAEATFKKQLNINEQLGSSNGLVASYANLGDVYQSTGDFQRAKEMYNKALEIAKFAGLQPIEFELKQILTDLEDKNNK